MTYATPYFTSFLDLFTYAGTQSGGMFGVVMLIAIWTLTFISFKYYRTELAFATSTFITLFVGVGFIFLGFIPMSALIILIIMTIVSIIALFVRD